MHRPFRLIALYLVFPICLLGRGLDVSVSAESAVLLDAETGEILFEKEAQAPFFPASISKVVTALIVLEESPDLQEEVVAPREAVVAISTAEKKKRKYRSPSHWIEFGSSHVGIKRGEALTVETLLYGLMLQSGNDAANVLAHHISGEIPLFVERMNERMEELGCTSTHFMNPHGLHHPEHVTCALDMAIATRAALAYPQFCELISATRFEKPETNLQPSTLWMQKNRLVRRGHKHHYPKAVGGKTGFTQDAQGTLVAVAQEGDRRLIAVVLKCSPFSKTYEDVTALFEAAFHERPVARVLLNAGRQEYRRDRIKTDLERDFVVAVYPSSCGEIALDVEWIKSDVPIVKGATVGHVVARTSAGRELGRVPLIARNGDRRPLFKIVSGWHPFAKAGVLAGGLLTLLLLLSRGRQERSGRGGS